uniref:Peptidase S1 domain-containing protein n=1 Tax=Prolemur simus TaxID=1328070 RepID=A0A8C9AAQ1_PROSS
NSIVVLFLSVSLNLFHDFIINGVKCRPHSQPWQVAIIKNNRIFCGGVLVHPQWVLSAAHCHQRKPQINDLMLIKLNKPVIESDSIHTINITSQCPTPGTTCVVSGWGHLPNALQCAHVPVRSAEDCRAAYPGVYNTGMLCAGSKQDGQGACKGDSGGPLVCDGVLQGIVSMGMFPCTPFMKPNLYTQVCVFFHWIQQTIRAN